MQNSESHHPSKKKHEDSGHKESFKMSFKSSFAEHEAKVHGAMPSEGDGVISKRRSPFYLNSMKYVSRHPHAQT